MKNMLGPSIGAENKTIVTVKTGRDFYDCCKTH